MLNKGHIPFPVRAIGFWVLLFAVFRAIFLALLVIPSTDTVTAEWSSVFVYGVRLDLSASAYLTIIPAVVWLSGIWTEKTGLIRASYRINNALLLVAIIVLIANLAVYSAWGTLINYRAISFLSDPEGIIASVSNLQLIGLLSSIALLFFVLSKIQNRLTHASPAMATSRTMKSLLTLFTIVFIPILMRGGLQVIPINGSAAWFSDRMVLNDAATNPVWYLFDNINRHRGHSSDAYTFLPDREAEKILRDILPHGQESPTLQLDSGTNIVLIVLESWTADIIGPMGGEKDVTPFFTSLCDSGILFSSVYASGSRTDHMFPALLSGLPSLPNKSMVRFNDKLSRLPMLPKILEKSGYTSLFFYGGELGFANMNSFLRQAGFKHISGADDYASDLHTGKWGVADGPVFMRMLDQLDKQPMPFFSMALTLSTHEPFDVPEEPASAIGNEPERFRKAARYTDRCLGNFFSEARNKSWYRNTLFILVADHGHILPKRRDYYDPATHRIPLLITGAGMPENWKGIVLRQPGGQHDLPATLLGMKGIASGEMPFSRNLLDTNLPKPVYINYEAGIGWLENDRQFVLLTDAGRTLSEYNRLNNRQDSLYLLNRGKAYLQCLNNLFESY